MCQGHCDGAIHVSCERSTSRSPKEEGSKVGQQASLDESISLLKQSAADMNAQVSLDTKMVMELLDLC